MAQDNRSIVITLKIDSSGSEATDTSNQTSTTKVSMESDNNASSKAIAAFAVAQVMQVVANETLNWAEYYWNKELTINDDYIGQRNKNIATTQINRAINAVSGIASATASGAMVGAKGGPWGAAIGAIVGFVVGTGTQIAGIARSNIQGQQQQEIMLRQMDAQLQFTRSRAGWSTQAASIGEDL